jgi:hypothetical protein
VFGPCLSVGAGSHLRIAGAIRPSSVQDSHMRLVRSALAAACFLAGLWLMLRALGLLGAVLHGAGMWWPTFFVVAGVAILARSVRPGAHTAVSVGLICVGGIAFTATRGVINGRTWTLAAAAGLMAVGAIWAWMLVSIRPDRADDPAATTVVLFRAASFTPRSSELRRIRVLLVCGRLDLDLTEAVHPGLNRDAIMIDITAWVGKVYVRVPPDVHVVNHKAFVMRFRHRIQSGVLREEQTDAADVVAATLAFFGDVLVLGPPPAVNILGGSLHRGGRGG